MYIFNNSTKQLAFNGAEMGRLLKYCNKNLFSLNKQNFHRFLILDITNSDFLTSKFSCHQYCKRNDLYYRNEKKRISQCQPTKNVAPLFLFSGEMCKNMYIWNIVADKCIRGFLFLRYFSFCLILQYFGSKVHFNFYIRHEP